MLFTAFILAFATRYDRQWVDLTGDMGGWGEAAGEGVVGGGG